MGFTEALTIALIVMKMMGCVDWSWLIVLLPEIIAVAFYFLLVALVLLNNSTYRRRGGKW